MSYQIIKVPFSNTEVLEQKPQQTKVTGMRGYFIGSTFEIKEEVYNWLYDNIGMSAKSIHDIKNHAGSIWFTTEHKYNNINDNYYYEFYNLHARKPRSL
jgi:hypothetical protein